jgi:hypothetical protein
MRFRIRTLLILLAIGPPMLALPQELREAYRRGQCSTSRELYTPTRIYGIPLRFSPFDPKIVPRQH